MEQVQGLQQVQHHFEAKTKTDWLGSLDIGFLTETERDMLIDVLRRDEKLRTYERKRIIQLKTELREIRRKGAKKADLSYSTHVCERCNTSTGHIINKAHTCPVCKHKTCERCQVNLKEFWVCVVCFQESKIKAKSGEWFFEVMRAELKPLTDGSTLLKRAVLETAPPKTHVTRGRHIAAPEIKYTPASSSSSSRRSSFNKSPDMTSMGSMESLPSSTESHSRSIYSRSGPAETGSIESLRSLRYLNREYFSDSDHSVASSMRSLSLKSSKTSTTPSPAGGRVVSTMPRIKQSLDSYSWSRDSTSIDEKTPSPRIRHENDNSSQCENASVQSKNSSLKKKLHVAGKKLQVHRALSRSVPSLAGPPVPPASAVDTESTHEDSLVLPGSKNMSLSTSNLAAKHEKVRRLSSGVGEIKFSLEYDYRENNLLVFISECRNLTYSDIQRKSCDPYVKCYLLPDRSIKRKTSSKKHTTAPKYNQTLKFAVDISELGNRVLEMSVWNSATFSRNSFLGHLQIGLDAWKWQPNPTPHWYPLKQKEIIRSDSVRSDVYKGDIVISVSYKSPEKCLNKYGELHVMVKQAKNLPASLPGGTVDAYARISILPEKDVQEKTLVITGSSNPVWNARFRLPFLHHPIQGSGLEISLWRKPRGSATTRRSRRLLLGGVRLASMKFKDPDNTMSTTDEERLIWEKICHSAGVWVDATLGLRVL